MVFSVAPFTFLQVQLERGSDAVELGESALCEAPKRLDPVDMGAPMGKAVLVFVDADANRDFFFPKKIVLCDDVVELLLLRR